MRSRPVFFLVVFGVIAAAALPARDAVASYASSRPGLGDAAAIIQVFGSFSPGIADDSRGGYGMALQWRLSSRFAVALDATRLSGGGGSISPFGVGLVYGPGSHGDVHPWVELGATYVRISPTGFVRPDWGPSIPGDAFGSYRYETPSSSEAWGPYFGAGLEWSATDRLGVFGGLRAYNGTEEGSLVVGPWDGAVAIRSGLTFGF